MSDTEAVGFQNRLENMAAEPEFDDVLDTAIETCLTDAAIFETALKEVREKRRETTEYNLVATLGLWGVRGAVEQASVGLELDGYERDFRDTHSGKSILYPEQLGEGPNREVQEKIEAFGKALLEESFNVLGEDAAEKAESFQAMDQSDRIATLEWLLNRIAQIRDAALKPIGQEGAGVDKEVGNAYNRIFHPARLSPKLIGKYPNVELSPTCLGLSILCASFLEKAGVPYMHAGLVRSNSYAAMDPHPTADQSRRSKPLGG